MTRNTILKVFSSSSGKLFFGFLILYVLLAVVTSATGGLRLSGDAAGYYQLAENLKNGNGFSRCDSPPYLPDASRTPVYPLFLLLFVQLFPQAQLLLIIVLAQALIAGLTLVLLNKSLFIIFAGAKPRPLNFAVIIFGLSPSFIASFLTLYSETVLMFVLSLFLLAAARLDKEVSLRKRIGYALLIGCLLGVLTLTKPICQFLAVVVLAYYLYRRKPKETVLVFFFFIMTISPWLLRNHSLFQEWKLSSVGDFNLYEFTARPLVSAEEFSKYEQGLPPLDRPPNQAVTPAGIGYLDFDQADRYRRIGLAVLNDHRPEYFRKAFWNFLRLPFIRGPNIVTQILNIDYKKYRAMALSEKMKDGKYLFLIAGAASEMAYRFIFTAVILFGVARALPAWRDFLKTTHVLILLIALYFVVVVAATMLNGFDIPRLILPSYLFWAAFIPFSIEKFQGIVARPNAIEMKRP